ncbi:hypothetical protein Tco_0445827 [Tanacetum coccineum]
MNGSCTQQFRTRADNDVWTKQFKPRSSSNDVWTKQFKPRPISLKRRRCTLHCALSSTEEEIAVLDHSHQQVSVLFWNTLTHDAKTGVYSFQVDEHWLTLSADLLRKALNVTPADSAHPFESPPAGKTDITFTRRRVPSNWLMKMKFNRLLNLIWMIMSTIYNKTSRKLPSRWIIASQDETTGPSVHPEDATSTKMVRETLSHEDAEFGGNLEKINSETDTKILNVGSNSKQSHVALAGPNPEHMQDVFLATRLAPSHVPATTNIPPIDKDLEILFQPMFDEYIEQSTDSEPVPTATGDVDPTLFTRKSDAIMRDVRKREEVRRECSVHLEYSWLALSTKKQRITAISTTERNTMQCLDANDQIL